MFPIFSSPGQFIFLTAMILLGGIYVLATPKIMAADSVWLALLFGLCISIIPMQLIAQVFEHRWMLPPSTQFKGFIYGDSFWLPLAISMLALLAHKADPNAGFLRWGAWSWIALATAFAVAFTFRFLEEAAYAPEAYTSPTKLFHDWFVMFIFAFVLLKYMPALWYSRIGLRGIVDGNFDGLVIVWVALASFGAWGYLAIAVDARIPKPPGAHIKYYWKDGRLFGRPGTGVNGPGAHVYLKP